MVSPTSPAIDGDWFDEELFEDQIGRRAAGFDENDEDKEVNDGSTVAEALWEEKYIDEETLPDIFSSELVSGLDLEGSSR